VLLGQHGLGPFGRPRARGTGRPAARRIFWPVLPFRSTPRRPADLPLAFLTLPPGPAARLRPPARAAAARDGGRNTAGKGVG